MGNRSRIYLAVLLYGTIAGTFGCSAASHRIEPSQVALDQDSVGTGDVVLVQYDGRRDPHNSGRIEQVRIDGVDEMGISGADPSGKEITIDFGQMLQIEHVKAGAKTSSGREASCVTMTDETRSTLLINTVAFAACFVLMFHGVACY